MSAWSDPVEHSTQILAHSWGLWVQWQYNYQSLWGAIWVLGLIQGVSPGLSLDPAWGPEGVSLGQTAHCLPLVGGRASLAVETNDASLEGAWHGGVPLLMGCCLGKAGSLSHEGLAGKDLFLDLLSEKWWIPLPGTARLTWCCWQDLCLVCRRMSLSGPSSIACLEHKEMLGPGPWALGPFLCCRQL